MSKSLLDEHLETLNITITFSAVEIKYFIKKMINAITDEDLERAIQEFVNVANTKIELEVIALLRSK